MLQLTVMWQPWFQGGEFVTVARSFFPPCGTLPLLKRGTQGRVVKLRCKADLFKARRRVRGESEGPLWKEGDMLINFNDGSKAWLPQDCSCYLVRVRVPFG